MSLPDEQIVEQNPWWRRADWQQDDPHLRRLGQQPTRFPAPFVANVDIDTPGIHIVRGPRQVGKSTDLKLLVPRALAAGRSPRQVLYLATDLLEDQPFAQLDATVRRAKQLSRGKPGALVLLDEVTSVARWQNAVKALWDSGIIDRDVVFCTGSSAMDLAFGAAERLPGRRGRGLDHLVLPQPFSVFARSLEPAIPASPALSVGDLLTPAGNEALQEVQLHNAELERAFSLYLRFGGLPASVAEAATGRTEPSRFAKRVILDSLLKEIRRRQISEPGLQALLERVTRSLGSKISWAAMAQEMDVPLGPRRTGAMHPDRRSVREYLELLAASYFIFILYFWKTGSDSSSLAKDKKLYFGDPLVHEVAHDYAPGLAPDLPSLVENAVGLALLRQYEAPERLIEGFLSPSDLHVWETARAGEVDFVCGPRSGLEVVEVKYQASIDGRVLSGLRRGFPGRPVIVATRNTLELGDHAALIPAHLLAWALV